MKKVVVRKTPGQPLNKEMFNQRLHPDKLAEKQVNIRKTIMEVPKHLATIEAEKGETIVGNFTGDGMPQFLEIKGKLHLKGGTFLAAPEDSYVYSRYHKMKIKDKTLLDAFGFKDPATPADISRKYNFAESTKGLFDPMSDKLQRKTYEMNIDNAMNKLGKLALVQEGMKGFPQGFPKVAMGYMLNMAVGPEMFMMNEEETPNNMPGMQMPIGQFGMSVPRYQVGGAMPRAQAQNSQYTWAPASSGMSAEQAAMLKAVRDSMTNANAGAKKKVVVKKAANPNAFRPLSAENQPKTFLKDMPGKVSPDMMKEYKKVKADVPSKSLSKQEVVDKVFGKGDTDYELEFSPLNFARKVAAELWSLGTLEDNYVYDALLNKTGKPSLALKPFTDYTGSNIERAREFMLDPETAPIFQQYMTGMQSTDKKEIQTIIDALDKRNIKNSWQWIPYSKESRKGEMMDALKERMENLYKIPAAKEKAKQNKYAVWSNVRSELEKSLKKKRDTLPPGSIAQFNIDSQLQQLDDIENGGFEKTGRVLKNIPEYYGRMLRAVSGLPDPTGGQKLYTGSQIEILKNIFKEHPIEGIQFPDFGDDGSVAPTEENMKNEEAIRKIIAPSAPADSTDMIRDAVITGANYNTNPDTTMVNTVPAAYNPMSDTTINEKDLEKMSVPALKRIVEQENKGRKVLYKALGGDYSLDRYQSKASQVLANKTKPNVTQPKVTQTTSQGGIDPFGNVLSDMQSIYIIPQGLDPREVPYNQKKAVSGIYGGADPVRFEKLMSPYLTEFEKKHGKFDYKNPRHIETFQSEYNPYAEKYIKDLAGQRGYSPEEAEKLAKYFVESQGFRGVKGKDLPAIDSQFGRFTASRFLPDLAPKKKPQEEVKKEDEKTTVTPRVEDEKKPDIKYNLPAPEFWWQDEVQGLADVRARARMEKETPQIFSSNPYLGRPVYQDPAAQAAAIQGMARTFRGRGSQEKATNAIVNLLGQTQNVNNQIANNFEGRKEQYLNMWNRQRAADLSRLDQLTDAADEAWRSQIQSWDDRATANYKQAITNMAEADFLNDTTSPQFWISPARGGMRPSFIRGRDIIAKDPNTSSDESFMAAIDRIRERDQNMTYQDALDIYKEMNRQPYSRAQSSRYPGARYNSTYMPGAYPGIGYPASYYNMNT